GTHSFSPSGIVSLNPSNSPLTVTATVAPNSSASLMTYPVTFMADSGSIHREATVSVVVGAAPVASFPTLSSITPSSGTTDSTVTVTLIGANFVSNGTTVLVSGSGVTVGATNITSATSFTTSLTIASNAAVGARTVTVMTSGGTSNGLTFNVVGAKSFNQTQTERLFGTWQFTYTILSTYTDTFRL